jgi:hypothetical protein
VLGETKNAYRILVKEIFVKNLLWKLQRTWKNNILVDLREIGCEDGSGWNWLRIVYSGWLWY